MKRCYKCGLDRSINDFPINRTRPDGRGNLCKPCKKRYNATYYQGTKDRHNPVRATRRRQVKAELQDKVYDYLRAHPCVDCGESDIVMLDFDHQGNKVAQITDMIQAMRPWSEVLQEIAKCEVVCANDHRRRTARMFGWKRATAVHQAPLAQRQSTGLLNRVVGCRNPHGARAGRQRPTSSPQKLACCGFESRLAHAMPSSSTGRTPASEAARVLVRIQGGQRLRSSPGRAAAS